MEQIIQIENNDDITAIRGRIEVALPGLAARSSQPASNGKTEPRRLVLVVPRKNAAMQSLVNMKLLARQMKNRSVELAIVSDQPVVRDYAKEAGVKVFGSLGSARRGGWISAKAPVAPPPASAAVAGLPPALPKSESQPRQPKKKYKVVMGSGRVNIWQQLGALALVCILALLLVVGVIVLVPQATVTLTPVARPVEAELIVKADPAAKSVDFKELKFPARVSQVELAMPGQIETIKTELAPVGLAGGAVVFINRTESEQLIPISTTVAASAGEQLEFMTTVTTTIPAGSGALTSTQVIAVEPGPPGNVSAGKVNRFVEPAYNLVARVVNEQPLSGGTMEPARVVEQADKDRLRAHLQQIVYQEGLAQLQAALGEQEFISPETLQVIVLDISYNEFAGDVSDTFSGEMQAVVRGTVVGGYNANRLSLAALEAQVPPGYELDIKGLHFGAGEVLDVSEGVVTFRIFASGQAIPMIDPNAVAQEIAWLPVGEAQAQLGQHYELATVPGVELQPAWVIDWLGRLPYYPLRIKVVVGQPVTQLVEGS
ncbi:MAG: baseplate J/gp47 family protein [Chloroflexota bacterium]